MKRSEFWGTGAADWAEIQEPLGRALFEALLDSLALAPGSALLDGGCGSGLLSALASERGFVVTGVDVSEAFIEYARGRKTGANFLIGDLRELPFAAESFDAMVGCNSFQFVPNPVTAVREAGRVLRPSGRLAIASFDDPTKCQGVALVGALLSLLPSRAGAPPDSPGPFALARTGVLERTLRDGGFEIEGEQQYVAVPWIYRDLETALRGFMATGPAQEARAVVGEDAVCAALTDAAAPYRQPDGSYRLENVFTFVVGRKRKDS